MEYLWGSGRLDSSTHHMLRERGLHRISQERKASSQEELNHYLRHPSAVVWSGALLGTLSASPAIRAKVKLQGSWGWPALRISPQCCWVAAFVQVPMQ
jgi:hypothetical protein